MSGVSQRDQIGTRKNRAAAVMVLNDANSEVSSKAPLHKLLSGRADTNTSASAAGKRSQTSTLTAGSIQTDVDAERDLDSVSALGAGSVVSNFEDDFDDEGGFLGIGDDDQFSDGSDSSDDEAAHQIECELLGKNYEVKSTHIIYYTISPRK
jgi:hypothetical protein